ncbi:MAG TPA: UPF0182 family protein [Candidatus Limnocylindria bacterium]|nr:UPF0182 family protein [Candidatus Limnocylindria bacterium]
MSSWFDRLLEELQRRQQEADARREGRPFPPRGAPRGRHPGPTPGVGDDGPDRTDGEPTPFPRQRRGPARGGRGGGAPPFGGPWASTDWGDWRRYRRWIFVGLGLVLLVVVLSLAGGIIDLLTDLQWFSALGLSGVLTTRLWSQVGLFVLGFFAFGIPAVVSVLVARRIAPRVPVRRIGGLELPDASGAIGIGLLALAVLGALISAAAWSSNWDTILLWRNGGSFGVTDAHFGHDVGFYVFGLPFWRFLQGWGVASLIGIILITLAAYAGGALRWQFRLSTPVRAHLTILGALLLLAIASGYQLDIAQLSFSTNGLGGAIQAATYADLHARQPAYVILTVVAVVAAGLVLANTWFKTLWLIGFAAGAWLVLSVVVGGIYPTIVQNLQVSPNERALEQPYIADNIAATRAAFDLNAISQTTFTGSQPLSRDLFTANSATLQNLRLWDYKPLLDTFDQQQLVYQYYDFPDVDIDRYLIDNTQREIMLSPRELDTTKLESAGLTWTNQHLVYTHGFGITAVPVNAVTPEGQPDYVVSGINQTPTLPVGEPRIYFGEGPSTYVVTGTQTTEFDYPVGGAAPSTTSWTGSTGVGIGGFFNRLLFALRFGDLNLLISNQLTDKSQILFNRTISDRVQAIAPFLTYDRDPYLVSAQGRLVWIWDAYTSTDRYPNAQPVSGELFNGMNYVRNSVKVVIDAYDGSIRFYIADPTDPIIKAWAAIFPGLFQPISSLSPELQAHLRYPEDLFTAQNQQYLLYHVSPDTNGADILYGQNDRWAFASQQTDVNGETATVAPYYVIMKLPGASKAEFTLIQPLVLAGRNNMTAWVAARMDPGHYGERIAYRFPTDTTTNGPTQIQSRIDQDPTISAQFTLWNTSGSGVVRGNLLVLPMGDAILYVEPIFLRSTSSSFPEFKRVILATQNRIAFADTVDSAVSQILGEASVPPPEGGGGTGGGGGGGTGGLPSTAAGLVARAQQLYAEAQAALRANPPDLGTYQARINQLNDVLAALAKLVGTPAPSASASPVASAAASP